MAGSQLKTKIYVLATCQSQRVRNMERYKNLSGQSNVVAYELAHGSISVEFASGTYRTYVYDSIRPGPVIVAELQRLAVAGRGINSYISSVVKSNFARKY